AISGVSAALPCRRSESVARRTFKISAALDTVRPRGSTISVLIKSPGCGGFFIGTTPCGHGSESACGLSLANKIPRIVGAAAPFPLRHFRIGTKRARAHHAARAVRAGFVFGGDDGA